MSKALNLRIVAERKRRRAAKRAAAINRLAALLYRPPAYVRPSEYQPLVFEG